jgi:hypothetical protein
MLKLKAVNHFIYFENRRTSSTLKNDLFFQLNKHEKSPAFGAGLFL